MDKFDDIFAKQTVLQVRLKNYPFNDPKQKQEYINMMTLALMDELMESIRVTPWKPWKKQQIFDKLKYQQELIDAFHFFINLCIAADLDADKLYKMYAEKNAENHKRQDAGY